jgi:hypothetical protein
MTGLRILEPDRELLARESGGQTSSAAHSRVQVLGALDLNFCVNAWGGPSCLGASLAHWMDAFIIFFASIVVVRLVSSWQGNIAECLLGSATKSSEP